MRRIVRVGTIVITILVVYCTYQIAVGGPLSSTFAAIFAGVSLLISIYQVISELRRSLQNRRPRESKVIVPGVQRGRRARSRVPVLARLREEYELLLTKPLFYRPNATPLLVPDHYVQAKIRQRNILVLKMTGFVLLALINAGSLGMIVSYVSSAQQGSCVVLTEKVTQVELSNYDLITNTNTSYTEYTFLFSFRLHTRDGQVSTVSQDDTGLRMQASESYGYTTFEEAERALANFHVGQRYPCSYQPSDVSQVWLTSG